MATLQVRKDDLSRSRIGESEAPALQDGQLLAQVDRFALTANNVTYGVVGEKLGYWSFFPAPGGWGVIPVWGFADVVASLRGSRLHRRRRADRHRRHVRQRARDRGPGVLEKRAFAFWRDGALQSRAWLKYDRERGMPAMQAAWHRVLGGESAPDRGLVIELR